MYKLILDQRLHFQLKDLSVTYVTLTEYAAKAWNTLALEAVEPVQTGCTIETRVGLTLVYLCLTPETHQQGFLTRQ